MTAEIFTYRVIEETRQPDSPADTYCDVEIEATCKE